MTILLSLFVTGMMLAPTTLALKLEWSVPWRLSSDWHIGMSAMHVTFSFMTLMYIGALWTIHMRSGWGKRKNQITGLIMLLIFLTLTLTGLGIYYLGDESLSTYASGIHLIAGLSIPLCFGLHYIPHTRPAKKSTRNKKSP
ncbi:MAG: hypothetical protein SFU55_02100 [Methylophilus sp.]|nr:hypothetical protein [Methylophilus sp.]